MDEIFTSGVAKRLSLNEIAGPYFGRMVTTRQVRLALRQLRGTATPEEFADQARVARATVYRIDDLEGTKMYSPRIETIAALAQARGLTLSSFFARIEGLPTAEVMGTDQMHRKAANDGHSVSAPDVLSTEQGRLLLVAALGKLADTIERATDRFARPQVSQAPRKTSRGR